MSTSTKRASYPYLTVARERGLDYGEVLWFADHLEHGWSPQNEWKPHYRMKRDDFEAVALVYYSEMQARAEAVRS